MSNHRERTDTLIRRADVPFLTATTLQITLPVVAVIVSHEFLNIPFAQALIVSAMCYIAILSGNRLRTLIIKVRVPSKEDRVEAARHTLRTESTIEMPWVQASARRSTAPNPQPAWPTAEPDEISDRGADERDPFPEHHRPRHAHVLRTDGSAGRPAPRVRPVGSGLHAKA